MSEYVFVDPISNQQCTLVAPLAGRIYPSGDEPKIGIAHPSCCELADVSPDLDAFYCRACHWNGRVTGAWVVDVIEIQERLGEVYTPEGVEIWLNSPNPLLRDRRPTDLIDARDVAPVFNAIGTLR